MDREYEERRSGSRSAPSILREAKREKESGDAEDMSWICFKEISSDLLRLGRVREGQRGGILQDANCSIISMTSLVWSKSINRNRPIAPPLAKACLPYAFLHTQVYLGHPDFRYENPEPFVLFVD